MASVTNTQFDLFISYPKETKWKPIISNVLFELRNRYKISFWVDYEQTESNRDLLKDARNGIQISNLFLCFLNRDYFLSFNCKEELKHAIKAYKEKMFILLDSECEKTLKSFIPNEDDYVKVEAYKELNFFQICQGKYFEMFIQLLFVLMESTNETLKEEESIMQINNGLKIIIKPSLSEKDKVKLIKFFESNRLSGGGEILNYEFRNNNQMLQITYKNYETKQRILSLKNIMFENHNLKIHDGDEFLNEDDYIESHRGLKLIPYKYLILFFKLFVFTEESQKVENQVKDKKNYVN